MAGQNLNTKLQGYTITYSINQLNFHIKSHWTTLYPSLYLSTFFCKVAAPSPPPPPHTCPAGWMHISIAIGERERGEI